ncbi:cytochrome b [Pseudomonas fulva]|uniref:cytochrome b n=1 Tax=Pseudomonas fulva TaxID=47880 RepID=UPI0015E46827|nr:cytochrome b [Pseudomonas fulva]MBA1220598.1 cytochrome b [Pseudomonas fulva]MBN4168060.1 cytochrome b [Pseudomonas fulva]
MKQVKGYTSAAKGLHWISGIIWIVAWVIGFVAVHWRDELNPAHFLTFLHKAIASTLILLVILRLAWRVTHPAPGMPETMSRSMQRAASVGHWLLYGLALIALPVSGWYWSSVADKPIMVAGLFPLPPLVGADEGMYPTAKAIHTYVGWFCGVLVLGHIAAALKHHFIDRDAVLKGMLPGGSH